MPDTPRLEEVEPVSDDINPEPRCPCVLLLDTSGSMQGPAIAALNKGLRAFKEDLMKDRLASLRVEVAVVTFDSEVKVVQDFVTVDEFEPPTLTAQGLTHMGSGIQKALDMTQARKAQLKARGLALYRPWVFMITDGEPEGEPGHVVDWAARRVKDQDNDQTKGVVFFAVGVEGANMTRLSQISERFYKLDGLRFIELFLWLSASMQKVSESKVGEQLALDPPDRRLMI